MKELQSIVGMCLLEVYEKGEAAIKTICNCTVPSEVMLLEYKKLEIKIEDLPTDEKETMWKEVYEMFPNKTKEERLIACKIIHTIGALL